MHPLFQALSGVMQRNKRGGKPCTVTWTQEMNLAFEQAKAALADATLLAYPVPDAQTAITVDASDVAVGGVLEQRVNSQWKPLAFFSRQLRKPELKYSTFDRELLALHLAIRHFRYFLEGRVFCAFTDHLPLTFAFSKISDPWSARQQRHLTAVSEYTTDIRHVEGKNNVVADALSRGFVGTINALSDNVDYLQMARAQQADGEVQAFRTACTNLQLQDVQFGPHQETLLCDVSTGKPRPVVPHAFRRQLFDTIHGLSHPSVHTTQKLMTAKFVWHGIRKQVGLWAKQCTACQSSKVQTHVRSPPETFAVPKARFDHINVDIVGPLPVSQGYSYLFTMVDRFTRWPEAIPIPDTNTTTCARALLSHWIARFGLPSDISSDRGSQFTSELWSDLCAILGTKIHRTTSYHPQSNGLVERFHRHLKSALKARLTTPTWTDQLPWVLLGIRTAPKADLQASSAELVYGTPLTVPGDFVATNSLPSPEEVLRRLRTTVTNLTPTPTSRHNRPITSVPSSLKDSAYIFLRRGASGGPLQRPYEGPYRVISHGEKTFRIDRGGHEEVVSVDRLKPAHLDLDQPVQVAQPPRRGRPPGNQRTQNSSPHQASTSARSGIQVRRNY